MKENSNMSSQLLRTSKVVTSQLKTDLPDFKVGSIVSVFYKIKDGEKERSQVFKGLVTNLKSGSSIDGTFTVTKNSFAGIKIERTFPLHSPLIEKIVVEEFRRARRANLNKLALERNDYAKTGRFKTAKALNKV